MSVFTFNRTGLTVDMKDYPPAPVVWLYNTVDCVCWLLLSCQDWRQWIGATGWLSTENKLPSYSTQFPPLLSLKEFRQMNHTLSFVGSLTSYVQQPSTNLADPTSLEGVCGILVVMFMIRTIKRYTLPIFSKFGRNAALQTHGKDWVLVNDTRITKFAEYAYRLCFHSAISFYGALFLFEPWWSQPELAFDGFPREPVSPTMTWYYLLQAAYNADAFVSLLELSLEFRQGRLMWSPTKRGDFTEMLVHHVATNFMIFGGSFFRLHRMGSMIFFLHDVSDVPVDLSKLANFLKWKVVTITCFTIMTLTWMWTRLYLLPFHILYACVVYSHNLMADGLSPLYYIAYRHFFYVGMNLLIALHAGWFLMFMKMLKTLLLKNEVHDYSEHKNGESTSSKKTN